MALGIETLQGSLLGWADARFAIVASRFNEFVVDRLVAGAVDCLVRHGLEPGQLTLLKVAGAWEIPVVAAHLARAGTFSGVIALGAVIRGETPHFEHVAGETANALSLLALETGVPVSFGVLTVDTTEQAIARAGGKAGNKGAEAALACLETAALIRSLPRKPA